MFIKAHAKINLTLGIQGLRTDGYHEVEMIMQTLALHDVLQIIPQEKGIEVKTNTKAIPHNEKNLAYQAALLLQKYTNCSKGAKIYIEKNIPISAGLAGGSADAAGVLRGLNILWELGLTHEKLMELGEQLGADVPFCLLGGTALARGKGQTLLALHKKNDLGVLLLKPPYGISTAKAYAQYDCLSPGEQPNTSAMVQALEQGDFEVVCHCLKNVLEGAAMVMHPDIMVFKNRLITAGAKGVLMSGSGPTVYGLFPNMALAQKAAECLEVKDCRVIVTSTC